MEVNDEPLDVESEWEKDIVSFGTLSQEELHYIVGNSKYRSILSDLLAPLVEEPLSEVRSVLSADHTITDDQSEKGSNTVVYKLPSRQEGGADTSPSMARKKALKRPSNGSSGQPGKRPKQASILMGIRSVNWRRQEHLHLEAKDLSGKQYLGI